jgi:hypothetical protein
MNDLTKQRDTYHTQLTSFQHVYEQLQDENSSLKDEVNRNFGFSFYFEMISFKISSKNEINRDLKLALTSSNNDTQSIYTQLRQLNTNHNNSQQTYEHTIAERDTQIEHLQSEQKQIIV